jgi:hypothetical protein
MGWAGWNANWMGWARENLGDEAAVTRVVCDRGDMDGPGLARMGRIRG